MAFRSEYKLYTKIVLASSTLTSGNKKYNFYLILVFFLCVIYSSVFLCDSVSM